MLGFVVNGILVGYGNVGVVVGFRVSLRIVKIKSVGELVISIGTFVGNVVDRENVGNKLMGAGEGYASVGVDVGHDCIVGITAVGQ